MQRRNGLLISVLTPAAARLSASACAWRYPATLERSHPIVAVEVASASCLPVAHEVQHHASRVASMCRPESCWTSRMYTYVVTIPTTARAMFAAA